MRNESCSFFTAKIIYKEYKAAFPKDFIHINWIAFALAILHKQGKIVKYNTKQWKWIADGGKDNGRN